jgi:hypothetical protein
MVRRGPADRYTEAARAFQAAFEALAANAFRRGGNPVRRGPAVQAPRPVSARR